MNLLIVDCDVNVNRILRKIFVGMFDDIFEAIDGQEGLEVFFDKAPDVVVAEVVMPRLNGWNMAKAIRRRKDLKQPAIVFCTCIGPRLNEMTSPLYEADGFIDKPIIPEDLIDVVERAIQRRNEGDYDSPVVHP